MDSITLLQPQKIVFGEDSIAQLSKEALLENANKILFLVATPLLKAVEPTVRSLQSLNIKTDLLEYKFLGEPTFSQFNELLETCEGYEPDCVIGIGGGSVLDCAKLLAALINATQKLEDVVGT